MKSETYCHHAFHQLALKDFYGDELQVAYPCCQMANNTDGEQYFKKRFEIDNLKELNPEQIFYSDRFQELRNNLKNGIKDPACKVCWDQEERGIKSYRQFSNDPWYDPQDESLSVIDITVSNQCNLRCRMCSPVASNLLYKDIKYFKDNNLTQDVEDAVKVKLLGAFPIETTKSIQWEWMLDNTDKIKVIKASGGEPFYDKKMLELLYKYIETGNAKDTILQFHTNATQFTSELIDILNEFKSNDHVFSVDGTGSVYEYIRYPASFKETNDSIKLYTDKVKNRGNLRFTLVVNAYNIFNIADYVKWARSIDPDCTINFQEVYPVDRGINIKRLPIHLLEQAKSMLPEVNETLTNIIDDAIINNEEDLNLLVKEVSLFDKSRNQDYREILTWLKI
jgi:hypothetical protein